MGTSGIAISSLLGTFSSVSSPLTFSSSTTDGSDLTASEWTPPQYAQPALTILTVPATTSGTTGQASTPATNYVFDAVLKIIHRRTLHKTQHPVLTGANIADHAYLMPSRVTLEIGMSDAMAAYADGVWVGAATKSVSAWQIIKQLMVNKTLITLTTRLDTYANMLVLEADAPDDNRTKHALRATITLEELVSGSVASTQPTSARPQTSGSTDNGTVQSSPVNSSQAQQNVLPSTAFPATPTYPQVPGAGSVSSNSLGQVPNE